MSNILKPISFGDKILDSQAWSCIDTISSEIETLELIYSLARSFKPNLCVELSKPRDFIANLIEMALKDNNFGDLINSSDTGYNSINKDLIKSADCIILNSYFSNKLDIFKKY